jgi:hypothetical protein
MNRLDEILTYRALAFKHVHLATNSSMIDAATSEGSTQTKNVCAHLSLPLVDRLESALGFLDMSKRAFIESAIIDALDRFDVIADQHRIFDELIAIEAAVDAEAAQRAIEDAQAELDAAHIAAEDAAYRLGVV